MVFGSPSAPVVKLDKHRKENVSHPLKQSLTHTHTKNPHVGLVTYILHGAGIFTYIWVIFRAHVGKYSISSIPSYPHIPLKWLAPREEILGASTSHLAQCHRPRPRGPRGPLLGPVLCRLQRRDLACQGLVGPHCQMGR